METLRSIGASPDEAAREVDDAVIVVSQLWDALGGAGDGEQCRDLATQELNFAFEPVEPVIACLAEYIEGVAEHIVIEVGLKRLAVRRRSGRWPRIFSPAGPARP